MKKKLLISLVVCMLVAFAFALSVSAEETECVHNCDKWTVSVGENGFLGNIEASGKCTICQKNVTEIIPSMFITLGYSSSSDGVLQGYGVNRPAIERYEELSGETVKFGGVIALRDTIGNKNPLNANGEPINEYVKSRDYTDTDINIINIAIKNIPDSAKAETELLCALYVNAGGRTTYIDNCAEKTTCGTKTYNEIAAVPETDKTELEESVVIEGKRYHLMTIEEMGLVARKYWNSKSSYTTDPTSKKFFGTKSMTKDDLPNGTIIYIEKTEWQYRPHKYNYNVDTERPSTTKTEYTVVDDAWWYDSENNYDYHAVGFNISYYKSDTATNDVSILGFINEKYTLEEVAEIFKIFVPITYTDDITGGELPPEAPEGGEDIGGETPPPSGEEGGTEIPPSTDYSDQKQNWQDDGVLKILAIGNSFSDDTMEHVYKVAKDAGIENIVLGKLYIGACSLETHLSNAQNNKSSYDYKVNTTGSWEAKGNKSIKYAVESDDWDFITFQQVSGYSGIAESYNDLYELVNIVEPLNPSARLVWNMTWAYSKTSSHSDFSKYGKDQMTMYNAILSAVSSKILPYNKIEYVIPCGTAIQNLRTSVIGEPTHDGYHLSKGIGRYTAAMTLVKALTGLSIDNTATLPSDVNSYYAMIAADCVNNAIDNPFVITNSEYVSKNGGSGIDDSANVGVIPEGYVQLNSLQMGLTFASFYNTTGAGAWQDIENGFARGFMATKKFTREELPVGSIIEIAVGWQYRPEGWKKAESRLDNVTTIRIIVDEDWWGSYYERGFNISQVGHTTNNYIEINMYTTDVATSVFKIYVPASVAPETVQPENPPYEYDYVKQVEPEDPETPDEPEVPDEPEDPKPNEPTIKYISSSDCVETVTVINGKEYRALTLDAMGLVKNGYYYSDKAGAEIYETGTTGTPSKYFATKTCTRDDLPVGAIIYVKSGWMYRPEGWSHTGSRPTEVTTEYVEADEAWWSTYTIRAFNIATKNKSSLVNTDAETVYENFKIYIPVEYIAD